MANPATAIADPGVAGGKAGLFLVSAVLAGTSPQTAGNYGTFFIAPFKCKVLSIRESHGVASSSGTVQVEKLTSGQNKDAGTDLCSSTISTSATADTPVSGTLTTTAASLELAAGNRLGLVNGGTLTSSEELCVTVEIAPIP